MRQKVEKVTMMDIFALILKFDEQAPKKFYITFFKPSWQLHWHFCTLPFDDFPFLFKFYDIDFYIIGESLIQKIKKFIKIWWDIKLVCDLGSTNES